MTDAFDWAFILRVLPRFAIATLTLKTLMVDLFGVTLDHEGPAKS